MLTLWPLLIAIVLAVFIPPLILTAPIIGVVTLVNAAVTLRRLEREHGSLGMLKVVIMFAAVLTPILACGGCMLLISSVP